MDGDTGIKAWILNVEGTESAPIVATYLAIFSRDVACGFRRITKGAA